MGRMGAQAPLLLAPTLARFAESPSRRRAACRPALLCQRCQSRAERDSQPEAARRGERAKGGNAGRAKQPAADVAADPAFGVEDGPPPFAVLVVTLNPGMEMTADFAN